MEYEQFLLVSYPSTKSVAFYAIPEAGCRFGNKLTLECSPYSPVEVTKCVPGAQINPEDPDQKCKCNPRTIFDPSIEKCVECSSCDGPTDIRIPEDFTSNELNFSQRKCYLDDKNIDCENNKVTCE